MNLDEIQRTMFELVRQPLTARERARPRMRDGQATRRVAEKIIKPNDRLSSLARIEIYNRVYWFRILSSLAEDFPGLRAIVGQRRFDELIRAYLNDCPSRSFTLRNLGSRLEGWLGAHPEFAPKRERMALDMVRLEWADIEAFDGAELPRLREGDLAALGGDPVLHLQPHLQLLDLAYPVDTLLLKLRKAGDTGSDIVSNTVIEIRRKRRQRRLALPRPRRTFLAVYRHRADESVYFKRVDADAFAVLRALREGRKLSEAIEAAFRARRMSSKESAAKVREWFQNWSSLGWFGKTA